jgi:hypothetical protein
VEGKGIKFAIRFCSRCFLLSEIPIFGIQRKKNFALLVFLPTEDREGIGTSSLKSGFRPIEEEIGYLSGVSLSGVSVSHHVVCWVRGSLCESAQAYLDFVPALALGSGGLFFIYVSLFHTFNLQPG